MAISTLNLPTFPKFDTDDFTTISTRWEKYKKRFLNLCVALNVEEDKQKLALLLNYIGEEAYDIYDNLLVPGTDETFANAITIFDGYFSPKKNIDYEVYTFRKLKQQPDENIHQFYIRLKQQANKCDFGTNLDKELKQQIVLSTHNSKIRKHAFKNTAISLADLLIYGKHLEDADQQADDVERSMNPQEEINRLTKKLETLRGKNLSSRGNSSSRKDNYKTCYRCGNDYPHSQACLAEGKECNKCHKIGHFARCCKSSARGPISRGRRLVNNNTATSDSSDSGAENVNSLHLFMLSTAGNANNNNNNCIASVRSNSNTHYESKVSVCVKNSEIKDYASVNSIERFYTKVKVEGVKPTRFLIDTGLL